MKLALGTTGLLIILALFALTPASSKAPSASASRIARGKYLVNQVSMCSDCHTPRNEKGEPIVAKYMKGAPTRFKPNVAMLVWADKAPNIAGMPGWENADAIRFLITGIAYNDLPARPPMPQYRFNQQDAEAVVAYLKSLAPADAPAE